MEKKDLIVIGAGPAGLAAAVEAKKEGIDDILVLEREEKAGGILNQCIHDGFGLLRFQELLTGPEYAGRYLDEAASLGVEIRCGHMVLDITDRKVTVISRGGLKTIGAKAVILAMGCRERTRGAIAIPGSRPAGIWTAGAAQNLVNLKNIMIGKRIVILGSGDIGLIMARRLTLEGAEVLAVVEKLPYPGGLTRNIVQCLDDYGIPLYLSRTVIRIEGQHRLTGLQTTALDERGAPVPGSEVHYNCDTLILSVGLIPENELSCQAGIALHPVTQGPLVDENLATSVPGIFACGNVLQVHDLVDHVSAEAVRAARAACRFIRKESMADGSIPVKAGIGVRYVLPATISGREDVLFSLRVEKPMEKVKIEVKSGERVIKRIKRNRCNPGEMEQFSLKESFFDGCLGLEVCCLD